MAKGKDAKKNVKKEPAKTKKQKKEEKRLKKSKQELKNRQLALRFDKTEKTS